MEKDYELKIENWANSIIELEEDDSIPAQIYPEQNNQSLIPVNIPTYYRSKGLLNTVSINQLINAADSLLTLATMLRKISIPPDADVLHRNICHEVKAFENKAQTLGFPPSIILAAKFVICALLDELIAITLWPELTWEKYSLVANFQLDPPNEEKFFLILETSLQDAAENIDLLELIYICLRLGYEGRYRKLEKGHLELRNINDQLYYIISQHRDEFTRSLLVTLDHFNHHYPIKQKLYSHFTLPTWVLSVVMLLILSTTFSYFYFQLAEVAKPIDQFLSSFLSSPVNVSSKVEVS